jgi:hypothetical protein
VTKLSQRAGDGPNAVIPGLPARAEPGIQSFFDLEFWIPGSAMQPRNDELRFVTNQVTDRVPRELPEEIRDG